VAVRGPWQAAVVAAPYEDLTARMMAVAHNLDRPLVYCNQARAAAEGFTTFDVRGGGVDAHRRAMGGLVSRWETHEPSPQELKDLRRLYPEASTWPVFPIPDEREALRRQGWFRRAWPQGGVGAVAAAAVRACRRRARGYRS